MTSRMSVCAGQQHDDAVDAGRHAAVRRRAVAEGVQHAAELPLDLARPDSRRSRRPCSMISGRWFRIAPEHSSTPLQTMSYW